ARARGAAPRRPRRRPAGRVRARRAPARSRRRRARACAGRASTYGELDELRLLDVPHAPRVVDPELLDPDEASGAPVGQHEMAQVRAVAAPQARDDRGVEERRLTAAYETPAQLAARHGEP